jgi:hypothetical protein
MRADPHEGTGQNPVPSPFQEIPGPGILIQESGIFPLAKTAFDGSFAALSTPTHSAGKLLAIPPPT